MRNNSFSVNWLNSLLVIVLVIGLFFRFTNLDQKVYWKDEVFTSLRVSGYAEKEVVDQLYDGEVVSMKSLHKYQRTNQEKGAIGTIKGLALEEAQLPPLYFLMSRFWVQIFGSSVTVTRSLSVFFSLLTFPCLYYLCRQLFKLSIVGWMAMALMAISPFFLLYAQEARPYSLWALTSLLSSCMFLRAFRLKTPLSWVIYGITVILGLYTSPFCLFINIGHGVYLIIIEKFQFNDTIKNYLFSFMAGIVGFSPWLFIIIFRFHQVQGRTDWSSRSYPNGVLELMFNWFRNITRIFMDFNNLNFNFEYIYQHPLYSIFSVIPLITLVITLVGYSIYFLFRHTPKQTWLFIWIFIGSAVLPLLIPDLILGGRRSTVARYLLPSYLGIQIALAYFLATQLVSNSVNIWKQRAWQIVTLLLFSIGIWSCINISPKQLWWNKDPSRYEQNPQIASIINQAINPLVISNTSWDQVMTLSYSLQSKTEFQLVGKQKIPKIPEDFSDYFLYKPSPTLLEGLKKDYDYTIKPVYKSDKPWLWRLQKK